MNAFLIDLLSIVTVISAILVITSKNPVVSVLYLICTFVSAACYLLVLGVGFVGISYLIVYVGAIAVLFLFVVMMLNIQISEIVSVGQEYTQSLPLAFIIGAVSFLELMSVLPSVNSQAGVIMMYVFDFINSLLFSSDALPSSSNYVNLLMPMNVPDASLTQFNHLESLSLNLYGYGSVWLFVTSLILLLAMMGPIVLCLRSRTADESSQS